MTIETLTFELELRMLSFCAVDRPIFQSSDTAEKWYGMYESYLLSMVVE